MKLLPHPTKHHHSSGNERNLAGAVLILSIVAHLLLPSARAQVVTRKAVLADIAAKVISPGYTDLDAKCRAMTNAIAQLALAPSQVSLDAARQAWMGVAAAANRLRCFQAGPIVDREYVAAFYYWKIHGSKVDNTIHDPRPIDQAFLKDQGADVKGLFTLEYLLFGQPHEAPGETKAAKTPLELLSGADAKRRCDFLLLVARDLEAKAAQLAADWTAPGEKGACGKFASGGQESINLLVNQLAAAVESASENRLHFTLDLPKPLAGQLYRIEGSASGSSLQGFVATIEGVQKMYLGVGGSGLADAVKPVNPQLDKRLREQFTTAISATQAINAPLEEAVIANRAAIQDASDKMKALEVMFKVDLTSALGVTLTFNSTDGD
jgi:uncharacterized protein